MGNNSEYSQKGITSKDIYKKTSEKESIQNARNDMPYNVRIDRNQFYFFFSTKNC